MSEEKGYSKIWLGLGAGGGGESQVQSHFGEFIFYCNNSSRKSAQEFSRRPMLLNERNELPLFHQFQSNDDDLSDSIVQ